MTVRKRLFVDMNAAIRELEAEFAREYAVTAQVEIPDTRWVLIFGKHERVWRLMVAEVQHFQQVGGGTTCLRNKQPLANWSVEARLKAANCITDLRKQLENEVGAQEERIVNAIDTYRGS